MYVLAHNSSEGYEHTTTPKQKTGQRQDAPGDNFVRFHTSHENMRVRKENTIRGCARIRAPPMTASPKTESEVRPPLWALALWALPPGP